MNFTRLLTLSGLLCFLSTSTYAYELQLRRLTNYSSTKVNVDPTTPNIWLVFQKNCSACRKQVKDLKCLEKTGSKVQLLGAFSSEKDLRTEYKRFKTNLPAYYADKSLLKKLQIEEPLTPQILISYESKNYLMLGYTECQTLLKFISSLRPVKSRKRPAI